jgi:hypothetical protein
MVRRIARTLTFIGLCLLGACQDGGKGAKSADSSVGASEASDDGASVFDEDGGAHHCRLESSECTDIQQASEDFEERCQVEGFHIVRCGCKDYCSGNSRSGELHYDIKNEGSLCEPARECEPTQTSAAFQDTCAESGGRFVQCGCAWRCSRKLKRPVPDKVELIDETPDAGAEDAGKGKKKAAKK